LPCNICSSTLLYIGDSPTCPKCEKLSVVPYEDSLKIADHFIAKHNQLFMEIIRKYKKIHIITNAFWSREKLIRNFTTNYSTLNIEKLLACNLLIRRLIESNEFLEKENIEESEIEKLIETYGVLSRFEEDRSKLEAGTWNMLKSVKYDLNNLEKLPLKDSIYLFPNENYNRVLETFSKYNITSQKKAEEKIQEWKKDLVPVVPGSNKIFSTKKTISKFYELISMLYMAFFRSKIYSEAFEMPNSKKITISPMDLKRFVSLYPTHDDGVSTRESTQFPGEVMSRFGGKYKQFFENFVISEKNPNASPLFLQIGDHVLLSQAFTELYCYFLHAILDKEEFDNETRKRSRIFESQIVKERFEKEGYRYIPNYLVKGKMEIDGISISDSNVFVIEVKGWGARRLLEERSSKEILERDIKNAIDGRHFDFSMKKTRKKVSLPRKVSWIRENKSRFRIPNNAEITGLLVINEKPLISEYNGCKIMFIDDFEYIKSGIRRQTV